MGETHWGKADFFCHPITKQWECNHCGKALKNNFALCECQKRKAPTP